MQTPTGVPDLSACQRGPREKVTDRLANILRDYQDDQIFYEMLQNADDAKATEMKVLVDWRQAPESTDKLLQADMQPWQGPAVWVYNDKLFSEKDFENIVKLGGHTKERDSSTIGKFGLGFSSVYHLTDVPCFISGSRYVIFDPYVKYLDKHVQENSPGLDIDFQKYPDLLYTTCSNQFKPFHNVFGCDTENSESPFYFAGTLFRLSLRTKELVNDISQTTDKPISEKSFDPSIVKMLVDNFERNAGKVLLFTKHVQKVSFYFLPPDKSPENLTELFSVSKTEVQKNETSKAITFRISTETKHTYTSTLALEVLQKKCSKKWLTVPYNSVETEEAYELSITPEGKKQGLVPFVEVATLHPTEDPFSLNGELFVFLPLSVETGLPVHINGCFAVTLNRQDICKSSSPELDNFNSKWNEALRQPVASAYAKLLSECQKILSQMQYEECKTKCLSNYRKMFPEISTSKFWIPLCIAVYKCLIENKCTILPVVKEKCIEWYPAGCDKECAFLAINNKSYGISNDLQAALINIGFKLTCWPGLRAKFSSSSVEIKTATPRNVFEFLKSKSCTLLNCEPRVQHLCDTPLKDSTVLLSLLKYILKQHSADEITTCPVPLLLTKDGFLRVFDAQNPVFCSRYSSLVLNNEYWSKFVQEDFVHLFMDAVWSGKQVKAFTIDDLAKMMGPTLCEKPTESPEWLKTFWKFVNEKNRNQSKEQSKKFLTNFQEVFKDHYVLPILPAGDQAESTSSPGKQLALQTHDICKVSEARDVFFFPPNHQPLEMCSVLRSLGCRELDVKITSPGSPTSIDYDYRDVAKSCVGTLDQPDKVANFFLTMDSARNYSSSIFTYLKAFMTASVQSSVVKCLPIFETISGELVSVADEKNVGYLKMRHKVPAELSEHVFTCFDGVLLAEKGMAELYKKLHFSQITFGQLYIRSVVPTLSELPLEQVLKHLRYITDKLIPELEENLEYQNLRILFEKLPEPLLKCANELAGTYGPVGELEEKSKLIVDCSLLAAKYSAGYEEFLNDLSKIQFIPSSAADEILSEIHEVYETDRRQHAISLVKGVPKSQEDLFWTVASLLPDWTKELWKYIPTGSKPGVSHVVDNCSNVCKSLDKERFEELSESAKARLMIVLKKHYELFQKHDDNDDVRKLKDVPIIPVGDHLVCAHQLTANIQKDIQPYLYRIPLEFGPFCKLFKSLGMSESPTPHQYCQVLKQIASDTGGLHPNKKENISTVVKDLFQNLSRCTGQVPDDLPTVFLPDKSQHLYPSNEMYVSDNPRLEDSVKALRDVHIVNLRECGVNGPAWEVVKCLPEAARPMLISDLFREDYAGSTCEKCPFGNSCSLVKCYKERLRSDEFAEGVCRIINYAFIHDPVDVSVEDILKSLETIEFNCMNVLQSHVVNINDGREVPESCRDVPYFVDHDDKGRPTVNLRHCEYPGNGPMVQCVADCVTNLLTQDLNIKSEKICEIARKVEWLILCSQVKDIRSVLADCQIPELEKEDHFHFPDLLGNIIPEGHPHDELLCRMSSDSDCQEGDYVGYQKDAGSDIYYGKIVSKIGSRYKVDIRTDVIECSFSDLYVFCPTTLPMAEPLDVGSTGHNDQVDAATQERENIIDRLERAENLPEIERHKEINKLRKELGEPGKEGLLEFFEELVERMNRERQAEYTSSKKKKKRKAVMQSTSSEAEEKPDALTPDTLVNDAAANERLVDCIKHLESANEALEQAQGCLQSYYDEYEFKPENPVISVTALSELIEKEIDGVKAKMASKERGTKRQNLTEDPSEDDVPSKKSKVL